jgi:PEGA domain
VFITLKKLVYYNFVSLVLISSCSTERWPKWSEEVSGQLKCGLSQLQVQEIAKVGITATSAKQFLGTHKISKGYADIWLRFDKNGLRSYLVTKATGFKVMRVSSRTDLCTGEISFLLRLQPSYELLSAEVYLDGERLEADFWSLPIEISAGRHELRIEKKGYMPMIRRISLEAGDPGEISVSLTEVKLQPSDKN